MDTENGVLELWSGRATTDAPEFLIFELRFLIENGGALSFHKRSVWDAGASEKRWVGRSVHVGKGALEMGKWTGFSRHFPDDSMQVVDFPHLSTLRLFWRGEITAEAQRRRGGEKDGVQTEIAVVGVEKGVSEGGWRRVMAENGCAQLHVFTRIYTLLHKISGNDEIRGRSARFAYSSVASSGVLRSGCRLSPPFAALCRLFGWGGVEESSKNRIERRSGIEGDDVDQPCRTRKNNNQD